MEYKLETFRNGNKGYRINFNTLQEIIIKLHPEETFGNGWYRNVYYSFWIKEDKNRTYISLKEYRNYKLRSSHNLGFYDNVENVYIVTNKYSKVTDVIKEYMECGE